MECITQAGIPSAGHRIRAKLCEPHISALSTLWQPDARCPTTTIRMPNGEEAPARARVSAGLQAGS